jgi:hypothetical protein
MLVNLRIQNKVNGIIKCHFGKCDDRVKITKLRIHIITSEVAFCCYRENWIINKRDAQILEAAQMRFLRPLLGPTTLVVHSRNKLKMKT